MNENITIRHYWLTKPINFESESIGGLRINYIGPVIIRQEETEQYDENNNVFITLHTLIVFPIVVSYSDSSITMVLDNIPSNTAFLFTRREWELLKESGTLEEIR